MANIGTIDTLVSRASAMAVGSATTQTKPQSKTNVMPVLPPERNVK